jgi:hypothetical protein
VNILWARRPEDPLLELRSRAPRTWQEAVRTGHVVPLRSRRRWSASRAAEGVGLWLGALLVGGWYAALLLGARWWLLGPWAAIGGAWIAVLELATR